MSGPLVIDPEGMPEHHDAFWEWAELIRARNELERAVQAGDPHAIAMVRELASMADGTPQPVRPPPPPLPRDGSAPF